MKILVSLPFTLVILVLVVGCTHGYPAKPSSPPGQANKGGNKNLTAMVTSTTQAPTSVVSTAASTFTDVATQFTPPSIESVGNLALLRPCDTGFRRNSSGICVKSV